MQKKGHSIYVLKLQKQTPSKIKQCIAHILKTWESDNQMFNYEEFAETQQCAFSTV